MKRFIFISFLALFVASTVDAAAKFRESPIGSVETAECVSISSTSWTLNPKTQFAGRDGVLVSYNTNDLTDIGAVLLTGSSDTPSLSTHTVSYLIDPSVGNGPEDVPAGMNIYLWMTIQSGAAELICTTQYKKE